MNVIDVAIKEIGYKENPLNSNKTKYGEWFGLNGVAWCAIFVSWCYSCIGKPIVGMGFKSGFAGCQSAVAYFKSKGKITTTPIAGDLVFYDWNADGRFDHVGLFEKKLNDVYFSAIEGNTSLGNNSNGGEVMRRQRSFNSHTIFVHL